MTRRTATATVVFLLATACGGTSSSHGNAAASKTFTYGAATTATAAQAAALQGSVTGATAVQAAPGATAAEGLADFSGVTDALLGSSGASLAAAGASPALVRAVASRAAVTAATTTTGGFDNPSCAVVTATGVTMRGCTITIVNGTTTEKISADGSMTLSNSNQTLTWDLSVGVNLVDTAMGLAETVSAHESGTLTVTATTIKGSMLAELDAAASYAGQTQSMGVDESLTIDVTYDPACLTGGVTGGTIEAKRVWTVLPAGATGPQYQNVAAKVEWTGCGVATIAIGH